MTRNNSLHSMLVVFVALTFGGGVAGCSGADEETDSISTVSQASNGQHFTKNGTPTCTDTGSLLVCTGELAGLGGQNLMLELSASALATFLCGAPGNNNQAAGQNKVPFTATGQQTIQGGAIKNGRVKFTVSAPSTPPPTPTAQQAGCPNNNWHVIGTSDIDFSNITLNIFQGGLLFHCTYPGTVLEGATVMLTCS